MKTEGRGKMESLSFFERLHALHRAWRYRLRSERDEIGFLLAQPLRGSTIVDVGAHRGAFTYWMQKKAGPAGCVVAFEPQPELQQYLRLLSTGFNWQNVTVEPLGLSSVPGHAILSRPPHHWGGASLEEPAVNSSNESLAVTVDTLDSYIARRPGLPPVAFIKIDTEGHELPILEGSAKVLSADRPTLLFECTDAIFSKGEVDAFLSSLGYVGSFFLRGKMTAVSELPRRRKEIPAPCLNYAYVHAGPARLP